VATIVAQLGNLFLLGGIVLVGIAVYNAVRAGRQSRHATYYAARQEALGKTRRWAFIAIMILAGTVGLALYMNSQPAAGSTAVVRVSPPAPASTNLAALPSKILPTASPTASPTLPPSPTPTATPIPTATLPPNLPDILRTPVPSAVPVSPEANLTFTTLASVVDNKGNPVNPGLAFPSGTRSVRLFFQASGVNDGAVWSVLCYKGDKLVDNVVDLWKWGPRAQSARAICGLDGSSGKYKATTYLGVNKQFDVEFELIPATPVPPPSTASPQ
jgi:hypothetical protein